MGILVALFGLTRHHSVGLDAGKDFGLNPQRQCQKLTAIVSDTL